MSDDALVSGRPVRGDVTGRLYPGLGSGPHPGVLVLHGGGGPGGYERTYAARLAAHGYHALCVSYFDAPGVPDALAEVPLSVVDRAARWLLDRDGACGVAGDGSAAGRNASGDTSTDGSTAGSERVAVVGFSRGAELALLGAAADRVGAVVAHAPSCYAFAAPTWMAGVDEEGPAWTRDGDPVPYLPVEQYVDDDHEGLDEALGSDAPNAAARAVDRAPPDLRERAAIPVERIDGPVLLVSGGADAVWPAEAFAERVLTRLADHDRPWRDDHLSFPAAGHAIRVPYRFDAGDDPEADHWLGGTAAANARASAVAWRATLEWLG